MFSFLCFRFIVVSIDRCFPSGAKNSIILNAENWLVGNPRRNKLAVGATTCVVCLSVYYGNGRECWMPQSKFCQPLLFNREKRRGGKGWHTLFSSPFFGSVHLSLSLFPLFSICSNTRRFFPFGSSVTFRRHDKTFPPKKDDANNSKTHMDSSKIKLTRKGEVRTRVSAGTLIAEGIKTKKGITYLLNK
jgi:hypothetical protein